MDEYFFTDQGTFYEQGLNEIMVEICNYTYVFRWDVYTHWCPNSSGGLNITMTS